MRNITPPPPERAHTPPAPRWGPGEDQWTPFTPRRSSRVAAQRSQKAQPAIAGTANITRHPFHSPPSSPLSPSRTPLPPSPSRKFLPRSSLRSRLASSSDAHIPSTLPLSDSDDDKHNTVSSKNPFLTPAKTPRKREIHKEALSSASKLMFQPRLARVEDAMPTPKKARRSKLFSLDLDDDQRGPSENIEVYTDSKERVPTVDPEEDNPFWDKPSTKPRQSKPAKKRSTRDARIDEAARNDEGIVYVFRGKKFLRRYEEVDGEDDDNLSDLEIRRRAGVPPSRRLTRSTLKPRILFPTEEQVRAREAAAADEADEEAVTDIEVPGPSTGRADASGPSPKSTGRKRSPARPAAEFRTPSPPMEPVGTPTASAEPANPAAPPNGAKPANKHLEKPKSGRSASPFDSWSRVKPVDSVGAAKGGTAKRRGSPLEKSAKRVRSAGHGPAV